MRALITGGTGLLARALRARLSDAVVLSRNPSRAAAKLAGVQVARWDPETEIAPRDALRGAEVIFHFAGEPVAEGRWTAAKKRRIRDSRVLGTRHLIAGLQALERKPEVLVSASAVGYYGDRGDEKLDESSSVGRGFLAEVCEEWEHEAQVGESLGVRVACVRIGIVLAKSGGALPRMLTPFKMGVGGRLGSGRQWTPWVHIDDVVGLLLHASRTPAVRGAINAVANHPVTNAELARTLGRVIHRPASIPVPQAALRVAFGEMSDLLTASQRVLPRVAERTGYAFEHTDLEAALRDVIAER